MLTQERLKELLHYDPDIGEFTWIRSKGSKAAGDTAGKLETDGYIRITIGGKRYRAHRLAFLYMTGDWPEHEVDHRDTDRSNNRWINLRPATRAQNMANANQTPQRNNASGYKGVYLNNDKWQSQIMMDGKPVHLGLYDCKHMAYAARCAAAAFAFGEFARF